MEVDTEGAWGAVSHIVTAPGRAFAVIAGRRPILAPLLVVGLISAAGAALVGHLYAVRFT